LQKGDFVINCPRVIELVAKLAILHKDISKQDLDVGISEK